MLRRFLNYADKVFDFTAAILTISDTRSRPQIPTHSILFSTLAMVLTRLGSLNAMEVELRLPRKLNTVIGDNKPSADTIGRVFTQIEPDNLRRLHWDNCYRLKRNKVLNTNFPFNAIAVDGHEFFSH